MGGRGASSGVSDKGKPYGSEYTTLYQSGNIKFIQSNSGNATAPFETMTKGRVYVTINNSGEPKYITYHDKHNGRFKQIDISGPSHKVKQKGKIITLKTPHTHKGYIHGEKGTFILSQKESKMVDRVLKICHNRDIKK
jgi:hypothetical protein